MTLKSCEYADKSRVFRDNQLFSYKTISKWENGASLPDINTLPKLSKMFQVSVDALLGLAPLNSNCYRPSNSGQSDYWEEKVEYLKSNSNVCLFFDDRSYGTFDSVIIKGKTTISEGDENEIDIVVTSTEVTGRSY